MQKLVLKRYIYISNMIGLDYFTVETPAQQTIAD
jgi:hypothetical protein